MTDRGLFADSHGDRDFKMTYQAKPNKILVADDDPVSRRMLESFLTKWNYDVTVVPDGTSALQVLDREDAPRLAVLDWMMPGMEGVQICQLIRARADRPYVYVLLLTARGEKQDLLKGLALGADDYLTKPFDSQELQARLHVGTRILELQDKLVSQARHDSLTGFLNRKAIFDTLQREVIRSLRNGNPLALIIADLDHFKAVNDTHGHPAGDAVLQEAARRILASTRTYDSVGRYGGEEFLIVAPGCGVTEAALLAERLRKGVAENAFNASGCAIAVTMSLGVADASSAQNAEELLRLADEALYKAKAGGRNRVEISGGSRIPALSRNS